jgi:TetR/AcrR family transcriptional regulator, regulator of mycofactocin system
MPVPLPVVPTPDASGRRERKKAATRQALADAAIRLFALRGFDATTIDEIAAVVDVSPRTFHRHFPRKEDVVFADNDRRVARLRAALAARPDDQPLLESIRDAVLEVLDELASRREIERTRSSLIASTPALRAHNLRYQDEWAQTIADHVARREGLAADDPWAALVGRCTLAVLAVSRPAWIDDPTGDMHAAVGEAFALLRRLGAEVPMGADR